VIEETRLPDANGVGDLLHRGPVVALLREQSRCVGQNLVANVQLSTIWSSSVYQMVGRLQGESSATTETCGIALREVL
jgi:hypothetical protein